MMYTYIFTYKIYDAKEIPKPDNISNKVNTDLRGKAIAYGIEHEVKAETLWDAMNAFKEWFKDHHAPHLWVRAQHRRVEPYENPTHRDYQVSQ